MAQFVRLIWAFIPHICGNIIFLRKGRKDWSGSLLSVYAVKVFSQRTRNVKTTSHQRRCIDVDTTLCTRHVPPSPHRVLKTRLYRLSRLSLSIVAMTLSYAMVGQADLGLHCLLMRYGHLIMARLERLIWAFVVCIRDRDYFLMARLGRLIWQFVVRTCSEGHFLMARLGKLVWAFSVRIRDKMHFLMARLGRLI